MDRLLEDRTQADLAEWLGVTQPTIHRAAKHGSMSGRLAAALIRRGVLEAAEVLVEKHFGEDVAEAVDTGGEAA